MPFIKLVDTHNCKPPETRDDGSPLRIGDEWLCDVKITEVQEGQPYERKCKRIWKRATSQRDGDYWYLDRRKG